MNNPKASQFATTRRDIPAARRLHPETRATALRPEDRPSGVQRAAAPDADATREDERESENEDAQEDLAR